MLISSQPLSIVIDGETVELVQSGLDPLARAVVISLFTWRRAKPDDVLPAGDDRQGWFGDTFAEVQGDRIGSRLWLLSREKIVPETLARAREYSREALQWLVDDGVASRVDVTVSRVGLSGVSIGASITRTDGTVRNLQFDDAWSALNGV